jgi:arginyl-tRNA synthetase
LPTVVDNLAAAEIGVDSDRRLCVFFDEDLLGIDGIPTPLIVCKRDGGYGIRDHRPRRHPPP